jgi:alpha-ketoglutarate-dependent taurine dioxygenase
VGRVLERLSAATRERFAERGFMLVRNFNDGFGLPWQEVFQTDDRAEVERYCRDNDIELEWREGDRLRTRQVRPAIRRHPKTGRQVWFNHAAFFHLTTYPEDVREALLAEVGLDGLPYNTFFGDGSEIPPEVAAEIRAAYEAETAAFPWREGDVLLLDNMSVAHGREPYTGERLVAAAMHEPWEDAA